MRHGFRWLAELLERRRDLLRESVDRWFRLPDDPPLSLTVLLLFGTPRTPVRRWYNARSLRGRYKPLWWLQLAVAFYLVGVPLLWLRYRWERHWDRIEWGALLPEILYQVGHWAWIDQPLLVAASATALVLSPLSVFMELGELWNLLFFWRPEWPSIRMGGLSIWIPARLEYSYYVNPYARGFWILGSGSSYYSLDVLPVLFSFLPPALGWWLLRWGYERTRRRQRNCDRRLLKTLLYRCHPGDYRWPPIYPLCKAVYIPLMEEEAEDKAEQDANPYADLDWVNFRTRLQWQQQFEWAHTVFPDTHGQAQLIMAPFRLLGLVLLLPWWVAFGPVYHLLRRLGFWRLLLSLPRYLWVWLVTCRPFRSTAGVAGLLQYPFYWGRRATDLEDCWELFYWWDDERMFYIAVALNQYELDEVLMTSAEHEHLYWVPQYEGGWGYLQFQDLLQRELKVFPTLLWLTLVELPARLLWRLLWRLPIGLVTVLLPEGGVVDRLRHRLQPWLRPLWQRWWSVEDFFWWLIAWTPLWLERGGFERFVMETVVSLSRYPHRVDRWLGASAAVARWGVRPAAAEDRLRRLLVAAVQRISAPFRTERFRHWLEFHRFRWLSLSWIFHPFGQLLPLFAVLVALSPFGVAMFHSAPGWPREHISYNWFVASTIFGLCLLLPPVRRWFYWDVREYAFISLAFVSTGRWLAIRDHRNVSFWFHFGDLQQVSEHLLLGLGSVLCRLLFSAPLQWLVEWGCFLQIHRWVPLLLAYVGSVLHLVYGLLLLWVVAPLDWLLGWFLRPFWWSLGYCWDLFRDWWVATLVDPLLQLLWHPLLQLLQQFPVLFWLMGLVVSLPSTILNVWWMTRSIRWMFRKYARPPHAHREFVAINPWLNHGWRHPLPTFPVYSIDAALLPRRRPWRPLFFAYGGPARAWDRFLGRSIFALPQLHSADFTRAYSRSPRPTPLDLYEVLSCRNRNKITPWWWRRHTGLSPFPPRVPKSYLFYQELYRRRTRPRRPEPLDMGRFSDEL